MWCVNAPVPAKGLTPSAKLIDHILQPLARAYDDYLHNSTSLIKILDDLHIPDDAILVSIDVANLFPSIPQSECLDIVYQEMDTHRDLLALDPNLIVRLLHLNMNYNYFEFAHLIFQQIKGTAMGAAFSPSIANIYMSTVVSKFLYTQKCKPLLFKRYIDDIFMIWSDTPEELATFMGSLNAVHQDLRFTHEHSTHTINFMDITIYKGHNFPLTNRLDTKTLQKPLNLYQYLHFSSNHPHKVYKAIIKGGVYTFCTDKFNKGNV